MNKIITVMLMSLILSVTMASAYEFEYEKPDIDSLSYQMFSVSRGFDLITKPIILAYAALNYARFYEGKLATCETELLIKPRSSGGGHGRRPQQVVYVEEPEEPTNNSTPEDPEVVELKADFTGNGQVDATDEFVWKCNYPMSEGANNSQGDADGDGDVDGADFLIWQQEYKGAAQDGAEFLKYQVLCN